MVVTCEVCGLEGPDVRLALVHWANHRPEWEAIPRCRDRAACYARVIESGKVWPLLEPSGKLPVRRTVKPSVRSWF